MSAYRRRVYSSYTEGSLQHLWLLLSSSWWPFRISYRFGVGSPDEVAADLRALAKIVEEEPKESLVNCQVKVRIRK